MHILIAAYTVAKFITFLIYIIFPEPQWGWLQNISIWCPSLKNIKIKNKTKTLIAILGMEVFADGWQLEAWNFYT